MKASPLEQLAFTETKDYEKGFADYFQKHIKKTLEPIEKIRLAQLAVIKKRKPIFFSIIGVLIVIILIFQSGPTLMAGGIIGLMSGYWTFFAPGKVYTKSAKLGIMPAIAKFFGDFQYELNGMIQTNLNSFKIVPHYDRYSSEDCLKGKYKNVNVQSAETHLERENRDEDGNITYSTTFKGMFILIDMNKSFKGQTVIKTDGGRIGNWFSKKFSGLENIKLEDPKFEDLFEVYGTNQIEARYLLTTAFMERFMDLAHIYDSKNIQASFIGKEIFIMIPSKKNLFEPKGIKESIIDINEIHKFLAQMYYVFQIVDVLKMNQKIGM